VTAASENGKTPRSGVKSVGVITVTVALSLPMTIIALMYRISDRRPAGRLSSS
jgi:hypothetical protein